MSIIATLISSNLLATQKGTFKEELFVHMDTLAWAPNNQLAIAPSCAWPSAAIHGEFIKTPTRKDFYHKYAIQMMQIKAPSDPYFMMLCHPSLALSHTPHAKLLDDLAFLNKPISGCRFFKNQPSEYRDRIASANENSKVFQPILLETALPTTPTSEPWSYRFIADVVFNITRHELLRDINPNPAARALSVLKDFKELVQKKGS